jgi:hypothetical protein
MKRAKNRPTTAAVPKKARRLGFLEGQFRIPEDFDSIGRAEIERMFSGREKRPARPRTKLGTQP